MVKSTPYSIEDLITLAIRFHLKIDLFKKNTDLSLLKKNFEAPEQCLEKAANFSKNTLLTNTVSGK